MKPRIKQSGTVFLCLIILLTLSSPTILHSEPGELKFQHISNEQGLSQVTVTAMLQDREGYLWIETQDGLNKYDGYSFKVYRHDQQDSRSLSNNSVAALYEDKSGTLWIGSRGGWTGSTRRRTNSYTIAKTRPTHTV